MFSLPKKGRKRHPVGHIFGVGQSRRETHKPDIVTGLLGNVPHSADNDLNYRPSLLTQQMDLINDDECDRRHITSVLPVSTDTIPFFGSCDENIGFLESFEIRGDVSGELEDGFLEWSLFKALFPIGDSLFGQSFERRYENDFTLRSVFEDS